MIRSSSHVAKPETTTLICDLIKHIEAVGEHLVVIRTATSAALLVADAIDPHEAILQSVKLGRKIGVPYCVGNALRLFQLDDFPELEPGLFGILEPKESLRNDPGKLVDPLSIDVAIVPGVAFDIHGG